MKIIDILDKATEPLISYEIIPPYRGKSASLVYNIIDELIKFSPPFIDVTSHAATPMYLKQGDGSFERRSTRKRPGTIGLCAAIKYRYKIETVPHILCEGFNQQETEDALIELNYLGVDNVMALTGDVINANQSIIKSKSNNKYSIDLVDQISRMNTGSYLDNIVDSAKSNFCIGVGGYPEKHPQSPSVEQDIRYLKSKVDAGAHYIVTQMCFNNSDYFRFVDLCRSNGIEVPIIPGLKLITKQSQLKSLAKHFSVDFPDDFVREMEGTKNKHEAIDVGIKFTLKQCESLLQANVPAIHFYVMQDVMHIKKIVSTLNKY